MNLIKRKLKTGQDEFGIILIDEEPNWIWIREDEAVIILH